MKSEFELSLDEIIKQNGDKKRKLDDSNLTNYLEMSLDQVIKLRDQENQRQRQPKPRPYERREQPPSDYRATEQMVRRIIQEELNKWTFRPQRPRRQWNQNFKRRDPGRRNSNHRSREPERRVREIETILCSPFAAVGLTNPSTLHFDPRRPIVYETPVKRQRRF